MKDTLRPLEALRHEIDAIDSELLRLVEARAKLARHIGEAKAEAGDQGLLRPDREAILLRKLINTPRDAASNEVIVRVWRELISENLRIQSKARGGLHLDLYAGDPSRETLVWARDRFGFAPAYGYLDDAASVVAAARDSTHIGVMSLDPRTGAWWARLLAEPEVRIIAALPESASNTNTGRPHAVAIAALRPEPTGDDLTFFVSDSPARESAVIAELSRRGLVAEFVTTAQGLKLFTLAGFVQESDERLTAPLGALSGIIGAAARL